MESISDLEQAVNLVLLGNTEEERLKIINKLLAGEANYDTDAGKQLMHRRALLMTILQERSIYPMKVKNDKSDK